MDTGMTCVQVANRGKWHVVVTTTASTTVCGLEIPAGAARRALELVDSDDRCRSEDCRMARAKARGLL